MNSNAFGKRLKGAIRAQGTTIERLSAETGISASAIKKWTGGHSEPGLGNLLTVAAALDLSIEWLATGGGAMHGEGRGRQGQRQNQSQGGQSYPNQLDRDGGLLGLVGEAIKRLYEEENARIATRALFALSYEKYNDIIATTDDAEVARSMIALIVTQLRKELRQAPSVDTAGKRQA